MIVLNYSKKFHKQIISACVKALQEGKVVAYPTDTFYGLAADASNTKAIQKLYKVKERGFNKPVHVVVPSIAYAKKIGKWDIRSQKLSKAFWPGPLTMVVPLVSNDITLKKLGAKTGTVGLRYPRNQVALDLAIKLKKPITATGANPMGGANAYTAEEVLSQFKDKKYKPEIIINAGKLPQRKPSTLLKLTFSGYEILRPGPITEKQIKKII